MYDKEWTQRICELTCSKNDVLGSQSAVKYDAEHPFKRYYSISVIRGAIGKYLSGEWDDRMLAHWACRYCWILLGGCDYDNVTEDLNAFERFVRDLITWDLDALSFFSAEDEDPQEMQNWLESFGHFDHIWQTRDEWRAVYAMIGRYAEENGDQYVLLINDKAREYMILYSEHLQNGYEDAYFRFVSRDEHEALAQRLKKDGYTMLSCSEEFYDMEIHDQ